MAKSPRKSAAPTGTYGRLKTSIEFPPDVWAKVKLIAAEKRITVNKVVIDACTKVLGLATQEEIDRMLPGYLKDRTESKPIMPTPKPQPVFRPWENCVISTAPMVIPDPEPKPEPKTEQPQKPARPGKRFSEAARILVDGFKELDS